MKALTVWQPWASLIAKGWKRYEFRSWPGFARMEGERIAIHAAARKPQLVEIYDLRNRVDEEESFVDPAAREWLDSIRLQDFPRSCIVATATLGRTLTPAEVAKIVGQDGVENDSDRADHFNFAWPMKDVRPVPGIPCRGAQGFWTVPVDIERQVAETLA